MNEVVSESTFIATNGIKFEWSEGSSPADGVVVHLSRGTPNAMIAAALAQLARAHDIGPLPVPFVLETRVS